MEILSLETIAIARDMFACIPNGDKTPLTPPYNEKAYTFFFLQSLWGRIDEEAHRLYDANTHEWEIRKLRIVMNELIYTEEGGRV